MTNAFARYDAWLQNDPRDDGGLEERATEEVLQEVLDRTTWQDTIDLIEGDLAEESKVSAEWWTFGGHDYNDILTRWSKTPTKWAWVVDVWQNTPTGRASLEKLVADRLEYWEKGDQDEGDWWER